MVSWTILPLLKVADTDVALAINESDVTFWNKSKDLVGHMKRLPTCSHLLQKTCQPFLPRLKSLETHYKSAPQSYVHQITSASWMPSWLDPLGQQSRPALYSMELKCQNELQRPNGRSLHQEKQLASNSESP